MCGHGQGVGVAHREGEGEVARGATGGGAAVAGAGRTDAVLVGDHLPELGADLVATLTALDSNELTHLVGVWESAHGAGGARRVSARRAAADVRAGGGPRAAEVIGGRCAVGASFGEVGATRKKCNCNGLPPLGFWRRGDITCIYRIHPI